MYFSWFHSAGMNKPFSRNQYVNVLFLYISMSYFTENFVDQTFCMSQTLARPITFTISDNIYL